MPVLLAAKAPVVLPDEPGTWAVGRWISGMRPLIDMADMPQYPLAPGILLAPLHWLPVDSTTRYRLGLVAGSLLVIAAAFLIRSSLRSLGADPALLAVVFAMALLFPATFLTSTFTWAEPTVLFCVALLLRCLVVCLCGPGSVSLRAILGSSAVAGVAASAHGRLTVVPVVWLGLLGWSACRKGEDTSLSRAPRMRLLAAALATTAATAALRILEHLVTADVWSESGSAEGRVPDAGGSGEVAGRGDGSCRSALVLDRCDAGACCPGRTPCTQNDLEPPHTRPCRCVRERAAGPQGHRHIGRSGPPHPRSDRGADRPGRLGHLGGFPGRAVGNAGVVETSRLSDVPLGPCGLRTVRRRVRVAGGHGRRVCPATVAGRAFLACTGRSRCRRHAERRDPCGGAGTESNWPRVCPRPSQASSSIAESRHALPLAGATLLSLAAIAAFALLVGPRHRFLLGFIGGLVVLGSFAAARLAVELHSSEGDEPLYEDIGEPAAGASTAVVPIDLNEDRPYVLLWYGQQVMLAPRGWTVDFAVEDSRMLALAPPTDAGMLILDNRTGVPSGPDDWEKRWSGEDATIWIRSP